MHPFEHVVGNSLALQKTYGRFRHNKLAPRQAYYPAASRQFFIPPHGYFTRWKRNPRIFHDRSIVEPDLIVNASNFVAVSESAGRSALINTHIDVGTHINVGAKRSEPILHPPSFGIQTFSPTPENFSKTPPPPCRLDGPEKRRRYIHPSTNSASGPNLRADRAASLRRKRRRRRPSRRCNQRAV